MKKVLVVLGLLMLSATVASAEVSDQWRLCRIDDERPGCEAKFNSGPAYQGAGDSGAAAGDAGDGGAGAGAGASSGDGGNGSSGEGCSK